MLKEIRGRRRAKNWLKVFPSSNYVVVVGGAEEEQWIPSLTGCPHPEKESTVRAGEHCLEN